MQLPSTPFLEATHVELVPPFQTSSISCFLVLKNAFDLQNKTKNFSPATFTFKALIKSMCFNPTKQRSSPKKRFLRVSLGPKL